MTWERIDAGSLSDDQRSLLDDHAAEVPAPDVQTDAIEAASRAVAENLEFHVRGAWRAGFDYLHVFHRHQLDTFDTDDLDQFSITQTVLPSNTETPMAVPSGCHYAYTYVLHDISRADLEVYLDE